MIQIQSNTNYFFRPTHTDYKSLIISKPVHRDRQNRHLKKQYDVLLWHRLEMVGSYCPLALILCRSRFVTTKNDNFIRMRIIWAQFGALGAFQEVIGISRLRILFHVAPD